jgi:hypothetical protein
MAGEDQERLYIMHFRNLEQVALAQLTAIQKQEAAAIDAWIGQKQMILDELLRLKEKRELAVCSRETQETAQRSLLQIMDHEAESRRLLAERSERIRLRLLNLQRNQIIRTAYENPAIAGNRR